MFSPKVAYQSQQRTVVILQDPFHFFFVIDVFAMDTADKLS